MVHYCLVELKECPHITGIELKECPHITGMQDKGVGHVVSAVQTFLNQFHFEFCQRALATGDTTTKEVNQLCKKAYLAGKTG
jgi:hypothetical protein